MKVILLRDVAKIGKRFEVVNVPDGYALNKLIPQKDAEPATPANLKRVQEKNKNNSQQQANDLENVKAVSAASTTSPLVIIMDANEQGHLFQSVHVADVVASAKKRGLAVTEAQIKISEPIKSLGLTSVEISAGNKTFPLAILVEAKSK